MGVKDGQRDVGFGVGSFDGFFVVVGFILGEKDGSTLGTIEGMTEGS